MNKNLTQILIFGGVLMILFWMMPNPKIDTIGTFFERLILPVSIVLSGKLILTKKSNKPKDD